MAPTHTHRPEAAAHMSSSLTARVSTRAPCTPRVPPSSERADSSVRLSSDQMRTQPSAPALTKLRLPLASASVPPV